MLNDSGTSLLGCSFNVTAGLPLITVIGEHAFVICMIYLHASLGGSLVVVSSLVKICVVKSFSSEMGALIHDNNLNFNLPAFHSEKLAKHFGLNYCLC